MEIDHVNTQSLDARTDSSITNLSLYGDRARITRDFTTKLTGGQNKITLTALPNVIDHDTLRIEGRGSAIIQGVTSFKAPLPDSDSRSPAMQDLVKQRERAKESLSRAKKVVESMEGYMGKLNVETLGISQLAQAMEIFESTGKTWDDKIHNISEEIERLTTEIENEASRVNQVSSSKKLRGVVVIDFFAYEATDITIVLIYTVSQASWESAYDVRVDSSNLESKAKVVYKAMIGQETGEDWVNAPITLETSQPAFGVRLPTMDDIPQNLGS